jgi:hypothetical protein
VYITVLLILAATPSLDAIDDANLALTTCGYSAYREADGQDQPLSQFEQTLESRCAGQLAQLRELAVQFNLGRKGLSRGAAENAADGLLADFRAGLISQYSQRDKLKAQIETLDRAMREEEK